jgi:hypothetical protein
MPQLNTTISPGLWRALLDYAERTQEPLTHLVSKALAEYLQVAHHTLYQVSTATALVEGIDQGAVRVGTLRAHGDLGLGTFENLDGEMVIVDGQVFQVHSDGSVRARDGDVLSSFAAMTRMDTVSPFRPITKFSAEIDAPQAVSEVVANAFRAAESGRPGAAFISAPQDIMTGGADGEVLTPAALCLGHHAHLVQPVGGGRSRGRT